MCHNLKDENENTYVTHPLPQVGPGGDHICIYIYNIYVYTPIVYRVYFRVFPVFQVGENLKQPDLHYVLGHVAMHRGEKPRRPILAEPAPRTWLDTEEEGIWNVQKSIPETFRSGWEQQELVEKRSQLVI